MSNTAVPGSVYDGVSVLAFVLCFQRSLVIKQLIKTMASTSRRSCVNHPDVFCYMCGEYTLKESRKPISDFVKRCYVAYFGVHLGDQHKAWAPHLVGKTCFEHWRQWANGKRKCLKFEL